MADPRAVIDRLAAAQNAHDLEGMLACFHEDYRSEQPLHPARAFQGIDQVRANWSASLGAIPDFRAELLRSAVDGGTIFVEVRWTGTKADGTPLDERGVMVMGISDDRIAWGRLYVDEVEREGAAIDGSSAAWRAPTKPSAQDAAAAMRGTRRSSATCSSKSTKRWISAFGALGDYEDSGASVGASRSSMGRGGRATRPRDTRRRRTIRFSSVRLAMCTVMLTGGSLFAPTTKGPTTGRTGR